MAKTEWLLKPDLDYGERWVEAFTRGALRQMHHFLIGAQRYHRRVILYRRFISEPRGEGRRLMTAFPYFFETSQLDLMALSNRPIGDPTAWTSKEVSTKAAGNRDAQVQKFAVDFRHLRLAGSLLKLHYAIDRWNDDPDADDDIIWDEMERLVRMELVHNGLPIY
jgi:hypothetical protein